MVTRAATLFDWPLRHQIAALGARRIEIAGRMKVLRPRSFRRVQLQGLLHDLTEQELKLEGQLKQEHSS